MAGEGTYVTDQGAKSLERVFIPRSPPTERYLTDLVETCLKVETEAAALCGQRASDDDLKQLAEIVDDMQKYFKKQGEGFARLDVDFHQAFAACSKNQDLDQLLRTISDSFQEVSVKSLQIPGDLELACVHDLKILEAIKRPNSRQARSAMRDHLRVFMTGYGVSLSTVKPESKGRKETGAMARQVSVPKPHITEAVRMKDQQTRQRHSPSAGYPCAG